MPLYSTSVWRISQHACKCKRVYTLEVLICLIDSFFLNFERSCDKKYQTKLIPLSLSIVHLYSTQSAFAALRVVPNNIYQSAAHPKCPLPVRNLDMVWDPPKLTPPNSISDVRDGDIRGTCVRGGANAEHALRINAVTIFTARCYASAVLAIPLCPSVRLSVTSRCSTKTAKRRITQTTSYDSPGSLVF